MNLAAPSGKWTERDAALQELVRLKTSGDPEGAHSDADAVLCSLLIMLGYRDIVDAWMAVPKWYA